MPETAYGEILDVNEDDFVVEEGFCSGIELTSSVKAV